MNLKSKILLVFLAGFLIFLAGYYFGVVRSAEKARVVEPSEVQVIAPVVEKAPPLMETELAGSDTCTVLPMKLELSDGVLCEVAEETTFVVEDEPANYTCSDGTWLAGAPNNEAKVWTIRQVSLIPGEGIPESRIDRVRDANIKKAWR